MEIIVIYVLYLLSLIEAYINDFHTRHGDRGYGSGGLGLVGSYKVHFINFMKDKHLFFIKPAGSTIISKGYKQTI